MKIDAKIKDCIHCHGTCKRSRARIIILCDKKTHEITPFECAICKDKKT